MPKECTNFCNYNVNGVCILASDVEHQSSQGAQPDDDGVRRWARNGWKAYISGVRSQKRGCAVPERVEQAISSNTPEFK